MSDSPSTGTDASATKTTSIVLAAAVILLTAGAAFGMGVLPERGAGDDSTIQETELAGLQTQDPRCGTHRSSNRSTASHPADGGYRLSINQTVPVAARDSELTADFRKVGEKRYLLDVQRTAGNRSTDCYLEMRFEATINMTQRDDYTLIVTVDRQYHELLYADPGSSGASASDHDPRPPSMNDSEWEAALNASDEYFYDETGESSGSGESGAGGDSATGGDSADGGGGAAGSGGSTGS